MTLLDLPNGYYDLPKGKLVNVVTCLEMVEKPVLTPPVWPDGYSLKRNSADDLDAFRSLFAKIGMDLMWFSRLIMADDHLKAILSNPKIESLAVMKGEDAIGLLELNFEDMPHAELAFFGLAKEAVGTGLGKILMAEAQVRAWARPITRFWVHTCHYDHPRAIGFYKASGFRAYAMKIEVHDDPRLSGHLPLGASPQIALIST